MLLILKQLDWWQLITNILLLPLSRLPYASYNLHCCTGKCFYNLTFILWKSEMEKKKKAHQTLALLFSFYYTFPYLQGFLCLKFEE